MVLSVGGIVAEADLVKAPSLKDQRRGTSPPPLVVNVDSMF
jgi:hypothetical protein